MKRNKVFVINPGSYTLKYGLSDQDLPLEIPHVISYKGVPLSLKSEIPSTIAENEICYLRRKLLEGRNMLKPLEINDVNPLIIKSFMEEDENLYFEEIGVKKENVIIPSSKDGKGDKDFIVGSSTKDFSRTYHPISQGCLNYELYDYSTNRIKDDLYRIWNYAFTSCLKGVKNPDIQEYSVVLVVSDHIQSEDLEVMLEVVFDLFGFGSCFVHQESVCATFGVGIGSTSGLCVIDLGHTKSNVVCIKNGMILDNTRFLLPFGGFDVSKSLAHIIHHCDFPLNSLFEGSTDLQPKKKKRRMLDEDEEEEDQPPPDKKEEDDELSTVHGSNDVFNLRNNYEHFCIFNSLKENHCFYPAMLSQKELFQYLTIVYQSTQYSFHLGDPLAIPVLGYFNPLLFFPFRQTVDYADRFRNADNLHFFDGRRGIVDNSKIYDLNYVEFLKHSFKTPGLFNSFQEYEKIQNEEFEEEGESEDEDDIEDFDQQQKKKKKQQHVNTWINNNSDKKRKRLENRRRRKVRNKKKKKKKSSDNNKTGGQINTISTFHDAVIKSIENSGLNLRRKRKRKNGKNDIDLEIVVVGGGAYLRGVVPKLQYLLIDYFSKKYQNESEARSSGDGKKKKVGKVITIGGDNSNTNNNLNLNSVNEAFTKPTRLETKVNISIYPDRSPSGNNNLMNNHNSMVNANNNNNNNSTNSSNKLDLRYASWKGAALTPTFKTIKKMWIHRDEFQSFGMKVVKSCVPFTLL